jgi:hypothetical protein
MSAIDLTLGQCAAALPALERLATREMPIRAAYALAKLMAAVHAEATLFEQQRGALVKQHGAERDATEAERATYGPRVMTVGPEAWDAFVGGLIELQQIPVAVPLAPFDLAILNGAGITPRDVALLGPLVTWTPPAET